MSSDDAEQLAWQAIKSGDYNEAVNLLQPLAERNSAYALLALGWIYETGATGTPDKDAARSLYEHAVSQGSPTACLYLGRLLLRSGREAEALAALEHGAQLNSGECQAELARLADRADERRVCKAFKERAYEEAARLLLPVAQRNSQFGHLWLGWIYETGAVGPPDWEAALSHYGRAAAQGSSIAYFELGRLHKRQGDEDRAREAFRRGAERGYLPSMLRLGTMMVEGRGGPADFEAGIAWIEKAAKNGHIFAQRALLRFEGRAANSIAGKLAVAMKIVTLGLRASKGMSKDPDSDKLRR